MIMEILHLCMRRGRRVWTIKDGYRLGMTSRPRSWPSPLASPRRLSATSSPQRTREALARKKAEGVHLGRPKGGLVQESKAHRQRGRHTGPAGRGHQLGPDRPPPPVDRSTLVRFAKSRMLEA